MLGRGDGGDRGGGDRGVGAFGTSIGFLVFLLFLFLAMQVMFGLYATSTLRATLNDAASRAAAGGTGGPPGQAELARIAAEAEGSLGEMGRRPSTVIELEVVDEDGDGVGDVVVGRARAVPPRFVPPSIGGMIGFEQITAGVRVRVERVR